MARCDMAFVRAKRSDQQVGVLEGDVQRAAFAGGVVMGHGCFKQVAGIVKLVAKLMLSYPSFRPAPGVRMCRIDGPCGIQVTVRLLGAADKSNEGVEVFCQYRIG